MSAGATATRKIDAILAAITGHRASGTLGRIGVACSANASAGGGGGGRDIPRGGVTRRALIGWLGVRRPGCGVGGVCAIAPLDAFACDSGVEACGAPVNRVRTALSCARSSS